jgi:hypothetical protein
MREGTFTRLLLRILSFCIRIFLKPASSNPKHLHRDHVGNGSARQDSFIGICLGQKFEVVEVWTLEKRSLKAWAPRWRSPDPGV